MAWSTDLQQASFRNIEFECVQTSESVSKALAIQQSPYSNKALIEDMGKDAEKISLRIFLSGENYLLYLNALIAAFTLTGEGELIHPIHGIKKVFVANWNIVHNTETVDGCDLDVEFVEAETKERALFTPTVDIEINTQTFFYTPASALANELGRLKDKDPNAFFKVINRIRNGLQKARQILGVVRSTVDNILSPPDWAVGLVDDVVRLATFEFTDISAISKWQSLSNRLKRVGQIFDDKDSSNDSPAFKQMWRAVTVASSASVAQAIVKQTKLEISQNQTSIEITQNFSSITPIDLAVIRQQVRTDIQKAIDIERAITQEQATISNIDPVTQVAQYKVLATIVHDQIQALIETRPPIHTTPILLHCTAHWLAHQLYGDMNRAEEIKRLNPTILNFALVQSGTELITYAR